MQMKILGQAMPGQ